MSIEWISFSDVFQRVDALSWDDLTFWDPVEGVTGPAKIAVVSDEDVVDLPDDRYDFAGRPKSFQIFLSVADLQDVAEVLKTQRENPTEPEFLRSVAHYWEQDAFLDLDSNPLH